MPVVPDTEILRTNPAFRKNSRRFRQDKASSADRTAAEMNEMPLVRVSVDARILAHRRDEYSIGKGEVSNRERIKQARHDCSKDIIRTRGMSKVQLRAVTIRTD